MRPTITTSFSSGSRGPHCSKKSLRLSQFLDQLRHDLEQVADETVISHAENGRVPRPC